MEIYGSKDSKLESLINQHCYIIQVESSKSTIERSKKANIQEKHLSSMATNNDEKLHIVMFPWLAFGHMIPYLELAKLIAQKGHQISFISTPRNIDRLPKLHPALASFITFVRIPLAHVENLPENAEATIDVPYEDVKYLKKAYDGLQKTLAEFLESSLPDWILFDFAAFWLPSIAKRLDIPCAFFSIFIASSMCCCVVPTSNLLNVEEDRTEPIHFTVPPKWIPFSSNNAFRYFEIAKIFDAFEANNASISDIDRFKETIQGCDLIAMRSSYELESEWLSLLETLHQTRVLPVGQLPTTSFDDPTATAGESAWLPLKQWLDNQEKGSVVYIAFGSEAKPSQTELTEIATGLELSGLPFLWVLRTRRGSTDTELITLPDGFETRTKNRGIVCTTWAPQLKILSHDSVGGFLTHSGWNSVVEAIQFGQDLILLSFLADTGLIARMLQEKKIGYRIPRNERDGSFTSYEVAESLKLVMVDEEGKIYRDKVKEMKSVFADKDRQDVYIDQFLAHLKGNHKKPMNG